jgi:hypothetical protein
MAKLTPTSDPLTRVRDALERADCQPRGREHDFTARCPSHPDNTPSLHVSEGEDGRVLLHCFAGCAAESVVAALRLTLADLFPRDPLSGPHWPRPLRDRYVEIAGRVNALEAGPAARGMRDADLLVDVLVQLARDSRQFTASVMFTCPECGAGHAWIRRNHAGLAADCDQGCDEHQVFTALARLGETEAAA